MAVTGARLDSAKSSLYNAAARKARRRGLFGAQVAQLVEHVTENHGVGGSIPPLGTTLARAVGPWLGGLICQQANTVDALARTRFN